MEILGYKTPKELNYHYDIFDESDMHCRECHYCGNRYGFQPYCALSGCSVEDYGYCDYIKEIDDRL